MAVHIHVDVDVPLHGVLERSVVALAVPPDDTILT